MTVRERSVGRYEVNATWRTTPRHAVVLLAAIAGGCALPEGGEGLTSVEEAVGARSASFQNGVAPSASYVGNSETTLAQNTPNRNQGAETNCRADGDLGAGADASCVLQWNLGTSIPAGSTVRSVSLQLNVTNAAGRSGSSYQIFALRRRFTEAGATWNASAANTPWQTPGARGTEDRGTTVIGTIAPSSTGRYAVSFNTAGLAVVQRWVDDPRSNFGIIIANSTTTDGLVFDSSESATASNRPRLTVGFDPPGTDAGTQPGTDASVTDTGSADTGTADAGSADTGTADTGAGIADSGSPDSGNGSIDTRFGASFSPTTSAYYDQLRSAFGGLEVRRSFDGTNGVTPFLNNYQEQDTARSAASAYSFKYPPVAVVAGTHDTAIRSFFQGIRDDHPVYWTYWHEPDDELYVNHTFTPAQYRAAWAHIRRIADQVRATRPRLKIHATLIIMVYSMSPRIAPNRPLTGPDGMYPGDDVIEVFGVDGYNTAADAGTERSAADQWGPVIDFAQAHNKPWAIGEIGSCPVVGNPQGRATYLRNSIRYWNSRNYRPLYVAYFNVDWSSCDYRMENDPYATAVWRQAITQGIGSF